MECDPTRELLRRSLCEHRPACQRHLLQHAPPGADGDGGKGTDGHHRGCAVRSGGGECRADRHRDARLATLGHLAALSFRNQRRQFRNQAPSLPHRSAPPERKAPAQAAAGGRRVHSAGCHHSGCNGIPSALVGHRSEQGGSARSRAARRAPGTRPQFPGPGRDPAPAQIGNHPR